MLEQKKWETVGKCGEIAEARLPGRGKGMVLGVLT